MHTLTSSDFKWNNERERSIWAKSERSVMMNFDNIFFFAFAFVIYYWSRPDGVFYVWSVCHMLQHHVSPPHVVFPEWYFWLSFTDFSYRFCYSTCCTTCTCAISDSKLCLMFVSERAEHSPTYISDSLMTFSSISWVLTCLDSCKSHLLAIRQIYTCSFELSLSCYSQ